MISSFGSAITSTHLKRLTIQINVLKALRYFAVKIALMLIKDPMILKLI